MIAASLVAVSIPDNARKPIATSQGLNQRRNMRKQTRFIRNIV